MVAIPAVMRPGWSVAWVGHRGTGFHQEPLKNPTMTRNQSALSSLVQELLDDPTLAHEEVFRRLLQAGLQDLINAEATARIGTDRYERTNQRTTRRNGNNTREEVLATPAGQLEEEVLATPAGQLEEEVLATPAGQLELAIPELREGSFFPSLLHPRRRVDKALYSVICTAWIEKGLHP